ncbi:MAG: hypothetical protein GY718_09825, partial [Lentisphaerae bacterium]|nr:hypothetical protein [Lentisphaerota bacterium]
MANRNRRKELIDSVRSLETRRGESPTGNIVNTKAQDVAGTTPARPKRGRTTLRREVRETDLRDVFRKDPEFFKQEDVTKPGTELLKTFKQQEATDVSRVQPPGVAPKGAGIGVIKRTQTPFSAFETSGQSKRTRERLGALGKLKPGESIDNFSIAQTPRGGTQRRKSPGIFTARGIEGFFGNLGSLAQKIVSPEFQS